MNVDWVRQLCLSFPGAIEQVVWEGDLTFKVGGKMFAHTVLEVAPVWLSFKCPGEKFAELIERAGVIPAPYLARAQWVALETKEAIAPDELAALLREAYDIVASKLPKKTRETLAQSGAKGLASPKRQKPKSNKKRRKKK